MEKLRASIFIIVIVATSVFFIQRVIVSKDNSIDVVKENKESVIEETSWATTSAPVGDSPNGCNLNGERIPCNQFFKEPAVLITFMFVGLFATLYLVLLIWAIVSILKAELPYKILWFLPLLFFPFIASIIIILITKNFEDLKKAAKNSTIEIK